MKNSADVSIPGTVSLTQGGAVGSDICSFILTSVFHVIYSAIIKGGSTGVKDLAGNARTSDKVWPFTTAPDTSPPLVVKTHQANGANRCPSYQDNNSDL